MLIIQRRGIKRYESAVLIMDGKGGKWHINPGKELFHATGHSYRREHCIMSFATGLTYAGHMVVMDEAFDGVSPWVRTHHPAVHFTVQSFFLVGLAWGANQWPRLKKQLQRVDRSVVVQRIQKTAEFQYAIGPQVLSHVRRIEIIY